MNYKQTAPIMPENFTEFCGAFNELGTGIGNLLTLVTKAKLEGIKSVERPYRQLIKYSYHSMEIGRPLNTAMIVMVGQSGSGKSTTINQLFDDANLCETSNDSSETRSVKEYCKLLEIRDPDFPLKGYISCVDIPGTHDVDASMEPKNVAVIKKFKEEHPALTVPRIDQRDVAIKQIALKIRKFVYPNLILLTVNACDNRMLGPDSKFNQSLKVIKELDLIDTTIVNLLVAVTHCLKFGLKKTKYSEAASKMKHNITQTVQQIIGIRNVRVVFIDNCAEDFMEKEDGNDFYRLPNGELSHRNLFRAIRDLFAFNSDYFGLLITGWYFDSRVREKTERATVFRNFTLADDKSSDKKNYLAPAKKLLRKIGISFDSGSPPDSPQQQRNNIASQQAALAEEVRHLKLDESGEHGFELIISDNTLVYLGHGYCPVTEYPRMQSVLNEKETIKTKTILGKKYAFPECITVTEENERYFDQTSFKSKKEYQQHCINAYGMEANTKLKLSQQVSFIGKWEDDKTYSNKEIDLSFLYEIRLVKIVLTNIKKTNFSENLQDDIDNLPEEFNPKNKENVAHFDNFFESWGSHFISEIWCGGSVRVNVTVERSKNTKNTKDEIKRNLELHFSFLTGNRMRPLSSLNTVFNLGKEQIIITGGDPMNVESSQHFTYESFNRWAESVNDKPVELENTIKLCGYHDFASNEMKKTSLKEATASYLKGTWDSVCNVRRNDESKKTVSRAKMDQSRCICM